MGEGSLDALLRAAAARWPDRPAVESPAGSLTYAELDAAVSAAAGGLLAAGARPGDRVAFALSADAPLYAAPFACARIGVTALLLPASLPPPRWAALLARAGPALCVADDAHADRLRAAAGDAAPAPARVALPLDGSARPGDLPAVPADPDRAVALVATSGTTGHPTIVRLTSRGLLHVGRAYLELLTLGEGERSLVVMPLTYIGVLSTQTMTIILVGGCNVLPADTRPAGALARMAAHRITLLDAVPAWLTLLAREDPVDVPTWRTLVHGGAPMPPATARTLAARHPRVALYDVWGLTEAHGPVTALRYDPARPAPPGTVGRPLAGLRVRARGAGGPLPPGVTGELEVAGPTVTGGTLDAPGGALREGWLPTGDLGTVAADGTVRITDRTKDLILRGGANVSSREVERVLCTAPGVDDAAVFPVPDVLGGEAVGAAVVPGLAAALDLNALRRLVAERVGVHAVPRRILCVDALPRNATGKVDKRALRAAAT
ncbi:MAG TPA: AMP-binding protein [Egibacteraceae bacterium]|nr:AMP-binding protein [Egibacteraceae bacterium]